jgi:hypothetical protein
MLQGRVTLLLSSLRRWHISYGTGEVCSTPLRLALTGVVSAPLLPPLLLQSWTSSSVGPMSAIMSPACARMLSTSTSTSLSQQFDTSQAATASHTQQRKSLDTQASRPKSGAQTKKPRYPFGGTRRGTHPKPHAGGVTAEVAAAQSWPAQVVRIDKVKGPYKVERKPIFAVVELGPTQFKVCHSVSLKSEHSHAARSRLTRRAHLPCRCLLTWQI